MLAVSPPTEFGYPSSLNLHVLMKQPLNRPSVSQPSARTSWLSIMAVFFLALLASILLCFLTMWFFLPVLVIGGIVVFLLTGFHYLVWGWWIGRILETEAEDE